MSGGSTHHALHAGVAHSVEHLFRKQEAAGAEPATGSTVGWCQR